MSKLNNSLDAAKRYIGGGGEEKEKKRYVWGNDPRNKREMKNLKVKNQRRYNKKIQHMSNLCCLESHLKQKDTARRKGWKKILIKYKPKEMLVK